jgi:hypothetical protein
MRKVAVAVSLTVLAAFAATLPAHPGHQHKALGTVGAVDASHVEIKTKDGKTVSVLVNADTKYLKGKTAGAPTDVKIGQRVAVTYVEKDEKYVATEVLLGVTDAPADSKAHEHP